MQLRPRMQLRPGHSDCLYYFVHWSYLAAGAPWQHTSCWEPPTEPTPTEPDRIAALEQRVVELEAFKKALQSSVVSYSLGDQP